PALEPEAVVEDEVGRFRVDQVGGGRLVAVDLGADLRDRLDPHRIPADDSRHIRYDGEGREHERPVIGLWGTSAASREREHSDEYGDPTKFRHTEILVAARARATPPTRASSHRA